MSKKKKYTKYNKYRKLITKIIRQGDTFGVDKITDMPKACKSMYCEDCLFGDGLCTRDERKAWLNSKYEEPKRVFTEEQKNFIRTCDKIKFLAIDSDGRLFSYPSKPSKCVDRWLGFGMVHINAITSIDFPQIKWSDKEPTSREEILGE